MQKLRLPLGFTRRCVMNLTLAVGLLVVGALLSFGSFIVALIKMMGPERRSGFNLHIVAMVGMAVGGLLAVLGLILGGWQVIQTILGG